MAVIDDVKTLTGSTEDIVINVYINRGKTIIRKYLSLRDSDTSDTIDIEATYPDALIEYVVNQYRKRGNEGIKQFSQGSRSGTYESGLSDDVKALLPLPKIRLMG